MTPPALNDNEGTDIATWLASVKPFTKEPPMPDNESYRKACLIGLCLLGCVLVAVIAGVV